MTTFRQRDGDLFVAPPFDVQMDDVFLLLLGADRARLQAICDNDLNLGPDRFEPLGDFVILYGAKIDNLSQGTSTRASEIGFWMPVTTSRRGETQLLTYSPYVWLSSSTSTRVGRSLYGYPKQVGDVRVPGPGDGLALELVAEALVANAAGQYDTEEVTILRAEPVVPRAWTRPPTHGLHHWLDLVALMAELTKELVALPNIKVTDLGQLLRGQRSVFLRQLPGVGALDPPSYQGLVEAAIVPRVDTVSGARLHQSDWQVTIPSYGQPKIVETLGLVGTPSPNGKSFVARPLGLAWMEFAGTLEAGKEIWRAPS